MKKTIISLFFIVILSINLQAAAGTPAAVAACTAATKGPTSAIQILTSTITTIYNILPIKIAGISLTPSMGLEDIAGKSSPICSLYIPLNTFTKSSKSFASISVSKVRPL